MNINIRMLAVLICMNNVKLTSQTQKTMQKRNNNLSPPGRCAPTSALTVYDEILCV